MHFILPAIYWNYNNNGFFIKNFIVIESLSCASNSIQMMSHIQKKKKKKADKKNKIFVVNFSFFGFHESQKRNLSKKFYNYFFFDLYDLFLNGDRKGNYNPRMLISTYITLSWLFTDNYRKNWIKSSFLEKLNQKYCFQVKKKKKLKSFFFQTEDYVLSLVYKIQLCIKIWK